MNSGGAVLVIEDDADVLRAARLALAPHVGLVETATSPQGLEILFAAHTFDAVLLDMNFAAGQRYGREGLDALAQIRGFDPGLAVVLMTAYGGVQLAVEALKCGATDFILKPWRNDSLIAAVTAAIEVTCSRRKGDTLHLDVIERRAIERALAHHAGNVSQAATALGLTRPALYRRMAKYGLAAVHSADGRAHEPQS
jgi:DNA-binding NtrC family response regulator